MTGTRHFALYYFLLLMPWIRLFNAPLCSRKQRFVEHMWNAFYGLLECINTASGEFTIGTQSIPTDEDRMFE